MSSLMKFLRKNALAAVTLSIVASGVVTYIYAGVQYSDQECTTLQMRSQIQQLASEVGLVDSEVLMIRTAQLDARAASAPPVPKGIPGVTTLGELARKQGVDVNAEKFDRDMQQNHVFMERIKQQIDASQNSLDVESTCLSVEGYSGSLVALQIALAGLASLIAFVAGTLKGAAEQASADATAVAAIEEEVSNYGASLLNTQNR